MTSKEAKDYLISLIERDTPMKVKAWSGRCPNCGGPEVRNSGFDFCQECGQRLDWEEE